MVLTDRNFNTSFFEVAGGGKKGSLPPNSTICWNPAKGLVRYT
jgi:hypothetical protein